MIARQWIGETLEPDADIYSKYLEETGISEIRATEGNRDVWLLRRVHDGKLNSLSSLCGTQSKPSRHSLGLSMKKPAIMLKTRDSC
jgi:hypothetical protein